MQNAELMDGGREGEGRREKGKRAEALMDQGLGDIQVASGYETGERGVRG